MISCDKCWADWASPEKEWHYHGCKSRAFGAYGAETEVSRAAATVIAPFKSRVAALLKDIEFDDGDKCGKTPDARCPFCKFQRRYGHEDDCALAQLLKETF